MVADEGVLGFGAGLGAGGGHTAVHEDPEGDVVTLQHRRLDVHHVVQEVDAGGPLPLPVL